MTCSRCGANNGLGAKSCAACGNALPAMLASGSTVAAPAAAGMPGYNIVSDHLPDGPPAEPLPPGAHKSTNGWAVVSLCIGIFLIYGSIPALIIGYIAKGQINRSGGRQVGKGFAIAGIVLGWIGVGFIGLGILAFFLARASR
jgi:hypothetical protein